MPPPRYEVPLPYDPDHQRLILFGGWRDLPAPDLGGWLNDTWAYDAAANAWTDLKPGGELPPVRQSYGMVYDPTTRRMILFGGIGGTDEQGWILTTTRGPMTPLPTPGPNSIQAAHHRLSAMVLRWFSTPPASGSSCSGVPTL